MSFQKNKCGRHLVDEAHVSSHVTAIDLDGLRPIKLLHSQYHAKVLEDSSIHLILFSRKKLKPHLFDEASPGSETNGNLSGWMTTWYSFAHANASKDSYSLPSG